MMKGYLLEVEKKHTLAGIFCNIKDMEEGDKESENSKITWCGAVSLSLFPLLRPPTPCPTSSLSILVSASPTSPIKR